MNAAPTAGTNANPVVARDPSHDTRTLTASILAARKQLRKGRKGRQSLRSVHTGVDYTGQNDEQRRRRPRGKARNDDDEEEDDRRVAEGGEEEEEEEEDPFVQLLGAFIPASIGRNPTAKLRRDSSIKQMEEAPPASAAAAARHMALASTRPAEERECIDALDVFEMVRHIRDPEHPLTLEQLNVVQLQLIHVIDGQDDKEDLSHEQATMDPRGVNKGHAVDTRDDCHMIDVDFAPPATRRRQMQASRAEVQLSFTPTIPHCSMATLIGLSLRVKLIRSLPKRFKVRVAVTPGTHAQEAAITKQLNDKERVAAALENAALLDVVNRCVVDTDVITDT